MNVNGHRFFTTLTTAYNEKKGLAHGSSERIQESISPEKYVDQRTDP